MYDDIDTAPCTLCHRPGAGIYHPGCRARLEEHLRVLPRLYRVLEVALVPTRGSSGGPVTGSRTAPLPCRLDTLDLRARGGIEGVLTTWERDVRELLGWDPPPACGSVEETVVSSAWFLLNQIPWIAEQHPAAYELADEIHQLVAHCRAVLGEEPAERRITLACATPDCTGVLRITLSTPGQQCGRCGTSYGWEALRALRPATRAVAA
ncbi:hypothetical protein [Wenjunlia vitaminophila]|uniref:hypothetical protein n=1 Tax=Wenjunlia vitaminophila TaxID=76728 RepID=UPI0003658D3F|nr:hypothetical protein [Wenjunlia vitaminophila]